MILTEAVQQCALRRKVFVLVPKKKEDLMSTETILVGAFICTTLIIKGLLLIPSAALPFFSLYILVAASFKHIFLPKMSPAANVDQPWGKFRLFKNILESYQDPFSHTWLINSTASATVTPIKNMWLLKFTYHYWSLSIHHKRGS